MTKRQKTTFTPQVDGLERREVLSAVIDHTIPFVIAPADVNQFAINFTSNRLHQVLKSLNADANSFARTGNVTKFESQLTAIAGQVPYGKQVLLNTWLADENSLQQLDTDLISYLDNNEGTAINLGKSGVNYSTDGLVTYNYSVGHHLPSSQPTVTGVTAM
ncbi:MAG: hypothetical protein ACLP7Q_02245 [Isosphaeraceae bacterium]